MTKIKKKKMVWYQEWSKKERKNIYSVKSFNYFHQKYQTIFYLFSVDVITESSGLAIQIVAPLFVIFTLNNKCVGKLELEKKCRFLIFRNCKK
jgi:hypothetical protein